MQATATARRYPMMPTLAVAMLIGAALDAAYAWGSAGPPVVDLRPAYLAGMLYLGVFASALAFTLYFGVIRAIGPARAAYSGVVVPVIAMLLSAGVWFGKAEPDAASTRVDRRLGRAEDQRRRMAARCRRCGRRVRASSAAPRRRWWHR